jgi:hypothetical protein
MSHSRHHRADAGVERRTEWANTTPPGATATNKTGRLEPISEQEIRLRAYRKWESAGRPNGDDVQFWLAAQHELEEARAATTLEP